MSINMLEYDGKAVFARHGIPVPVGAIFPDIPRSERGYMVKAQIAAGGRGKSGGVRPADTVATARQAAEALLSFEKSGVATRCVLIEERIAIARELYLAIAVDRNRGQLCIMASQQGGIDVESLPDDDVAHILIDPLLGYQDFHAAAVSAFLELEQEAADQCGAILASLFDISCELDAELVEINPLALDTGGRLVACDAKLVLDSNAAFRRAAFPGHRETSVDASTEERIAVAGAVAIEIDSDGELTSVVSGAGLMMATLDVLAERGIRSRHVVDLGGSVLKGPDHLQCVFDAILETGTPNLFVNSFMQTGLCDTIARAYAAAREKSGYSGDAVFRLKGRNVDSAKRILEVFDHPIYDDLSSAFDALDARVGRAGP